MKSQEEIEVVLVTIRPREQGPEEMAVVQALSWILEEDDGNVMNPVTYLSLGDPL